MPFKLGILLSGSGTSLQNIIDHIDRGELDAEVACVVASRADAYGLVRAEKHGIPAYAAPRKQYSNGQAFNEAIWAPVLEHEVELVVLAGFMSLLQVPTAFHHKIVNVHPALIPAFCGQGMYGHHVHQAVVDYGAKVSGATVHFVDEVYDNGPIILQGTVPVLQGDTADTLAERVQEKEREIYPQAIGLIAAGKVRVEGRKVIIEGES